MKKAILIIFCMFLASATFAQDTTAKPPVDTLSLFRKTLRASITSEISLMPQRVDHYSWILINNKNGNITMDDPMANNMNLLIHFTHKYRIYRLNDSTAIIKPYISKPHKRKK